MTWFVYICCGLKKLHDMGISHRQLDSRAIYLAGCPENYDFALKIGNLG
jgi:serine/threonine protein kinase